MNVGTRLFCYNFDDDSWHTSLFSDIEQVKNFIEKNYKWYSYCELAKISKEEAESILILRELQK